METYTDIDWENVDMQKIKDGIYYDMPIDVYHSNKTHDSSSTLKPAFKSMAHYNANKNKKSEKKLHFDFGNAFELNITDTEGFNKNVSVFNIDEKPIKDKDFRTKDNSEWKKKFYKDNDSKLIIPFRGDDSVDTILELKESFFNHPSARNLIKGANYQTSIFWTCKNTGLKLKTRPDFWKPSNDKRDFSIVSDLKTDKDTTTDLHIKSICNRDYPIQAIIQLKGLFASGLITSIESTRFFWIFCCKQTPYNTEVYEFDSYDIERFIDVVDFKLKELSLAKEKGVFLSYNPNRLAGIKQVEFPFWYKKQIGVNEDIGEKII